MPEDNDPVAARAFWKIAGAGALAPRAVFVLPEDNDPVAARAFWKIAGAGALAPRAVFVLAVCASILRVCLLVRLARWDRG